MEIRDKNNELLAILLKFNEFKNGKYFATNNSEEFQLASFDLNKDEIIEKHYHPEQNRTIRKTSEVIVVLDGKIEIEIYDNDLNFVHKEILLFGDTVSLISGGHGLKIIDDSKFVEVKQGPFIPEVDKKRF